MEEAAASPLAMDAGAATRAVENVYGLEPVLGDRDGPLQWLQYVLVRAGAESLALLPWRLRWSMLTALGHVARRLDRRHADSAREFLRAALGTDLSRERREELVAGAFRHLSSVAIDSILRGRARGPVADRYRVEACPEARTLLADPQPTVFITAHIGDWEASTQWITSAGFRPMFVVAKAPKNRPLSVWMQRRREHEDVHLLSRYGAIEGARRVVAGGGSLGFLLDHRATSKPVIAPFFGRPALCERTSGVLLRRLRRPAMILGCYRTERPLHYRLVLPRVFQPQELARLSPEAVATTINAELEKLILAAPEQYHWLHDRYRGVEKALAERALTQADRRSQ